MDEKENYRALCQLVDTDNDTLSVFEKAHIVYMALMFRWGTEKIQEETRKLTEWYKNGETAE